MDSAHKEVVEQLRDIAEAAEKAAATTSPTTLRLKARELGRRVLALHEAVGRAEGGEK
jgi:hypothetical protein